jgi:hypothetical protein
MFSKSKTNELTIRETGIMTICRAGDHLEAVQILTCKRIRIRKSVGFQYIELSDR